MSSNIKNVSNFAPTSENALIAKENGTLDQWIEDLLHSEGNDALSKSLFKEKTVAIEIYDYPLAGLKKIVGPEENEEHRQSPDVWEAQVSKIAKLIKNGYKPAPLIVTDFWNYFEIADGNHRQEAMIRTGMTRYWTIFMIKHEEGKKYLESIIKK